MKKRILTGCLMFVILVPVVIFPQLDHLCEIFMALFAVIAMLELLFMYDHSKKVPWPMKVLSVLLMLMLYFSIIYSLKEKIMGVRTSSGNDTVPLVFTAMEALHIDGITPVLALIVIFIVLMSGTVFIGHFDVTDLGRLYIAIIYIAVSVSCFNILKLFGTRFVILLMVITMTTDIFALFFGMSLGKHKMAPSISPKKTWEGAIGGSFVAVVIASAVMLCYPYFSKVFHGESIEFFEYVIDMSGSPMGVKVFFTILLVLFISICGQIGDLIASKLKRAYGIKDYSNIFPGHGGMLDRFDSTFFASAIFVFMIVIGMTLFGVAA